MFKIIKERFSKYKRLAKKQPEILRYEELEQRVLFSADVVPGLDTAAVEEQVIVEDMGSDVQSEREAASETVEQTSEEARSELVLVNENVTDYEQLIADLNSSDDHRIIEVVVLESNRDGIEQVSEILSERSDLAAVHFISHGADGQINLGDTWLDSATLHQNPDAVAGWGNALTENGDILFYGCNTAFDSDGQNLLDDIAQLTGADVAASNDLTGNAEKGGDWDLEYTAGAIETEISVSSNLQGGWSHLLAAPTFWDYHHTIELAASTAVADYPVKLELTEGANGFNHANAQANGGDLRFFGAAGNELSYWIEDWDSGGTSTIWIKIATPGTTTLEIFYGNPSVSSASDPTATFHYYDDFEDDSVGALPTGWTLAQGAPTGTPPSIKDDGGNLIFSDGNNNGGPVVSTGNWADVVVSQDFRTSNSVDAISHAGLIARYADVDNMVYGGIVDKDTAQIWYRNGGTFTQIGGDWSITALNVNDTNWHNQELRLFGDTVELYIDETFIGSASLASTGAPASGSTGFWSQYSGSVEAYRDNHIVRSYDSGTGDITSTMANEGFAIDENSANGTFVGHVVASDPDVADVLTYSITGGNTGSAFAINSGNGEITVNNSSALDFETTPTFTLTVQIDDGNGGTDVQTISITVTNANDAPTFIDGSVGNWNFDEGSGDSIVESAIGISTGTLGSTAGADANDPTWTTGKFGQALHFDGVNDYIEIADAPGIDISGSEFSASLWVKPDRGPDQEDMFFMKGDRQGIGNVNYYLSWKDTNKMTWAFKSDGGFEYLDIDVTLPTVGEWNHIAVVFNRPTVSLYINGTEYTFNNVATGGTSMDKDLVANDEPLWIGAGRDGGDIVTPGNYSAPFSGAIDEFAIFDRALTDAEIEAIRTSTPPAVTASAFSIDENSANNTVVGTVVANDQDIGDTLSYAITAGNTGGAFSIDANGQIKVANSTALDFETNPTFNLTIEATDDGSPNLSDTMTVTITLANVDDAPMQVNNTGSTVTEGGTGALTNTELRYDDYEQPASSVTYTVTGGLANGQLELTTDPGTAVTSFTQDDIDNNRLIYVHDDSETTSDSFNFTVDDGQGNSVTGQYFAITVTPVNDAPVAREDRVGLTFDGVDDYVRIGDYPGLAASNSVTMEAWIRPSGAGTGTQIIVNKEGEYEFAITSDTGEIKWSFANTDPGWGWHNTGYFAQAGEWTHIAVSYNNGVVNTYADGALVDTHNGTGVIADQYPAFNELQIGGRENAVTQRFDGQIDEVRVWDTERTQLEIQTNMNTLLAGNETGLLGNWRFDEGSGTTISDQSVNGHHGTLADGITVAEMPAWEGYVVSEDGTLNVSAANGVLANDFDIDGDPLTAVLDSGPSNAASFTLNPDGSFTYTPVANFNGVDTFTYYANDGSADSNIVTVTIRVDPANDVPVINNATFALNENSINGTAVGTVPVTDPDASDTHVYTITAGNTGGAFNIDNAGNITVANSMALNFETTPVFTLTVQVQDQGGTGLLDTATITVNLNDLNEFAVSVVSDNDDAANTVAEDAIVGTTVGITTLATDADGTDTVTYSLSDDAGGLFTIDSNTGVITVANALDYETATSHSVTVLATSSDTSTSSQAFTINVTDINESAVGPVTDGDVAANTVAESALVGDTVGITALATDVDGTDTVTYSLSDDAGGLFTIDSNTGVITVANALDYETATSHSVTVLATSSDTSTSSQAFTISVTDINESAVGPITDNDGTANTVAENVLVGDTVGITALATDPDAGDTVTYSLSDDAGGLFTIDTNTGVITVANALDYETATSHSVTVLATSSDTSTSSQAFTINVTDINESAVGPVTDGNAAANTVAESALVGDTVGITALATDADGTDTVTYSLSDDAGGLFTIDTNTGVITVANALDYETSTSHSVTVLATSSDTSTSSQAFTINVADINESAVGPVTDNDGTANTVTENALVGDTVGITALAVDPDAGDTVTYSLSDDAGGLFTIDANTGVITVANALDYETATSHSVTVLATSSDTSTSSQAFTINVTDINESAVGPVSDNDAAPNTVSEDAIVGTTVGITALATDADGTDSVTYSLSDDAGGLFTIESNTGIITVANTLDYETATSHSVTVLATSSDTSTSNQVFTINVTDVNESAVGAVTDTNAAANTVAEDVLLGDTVGITALATDADGTDTVTYSLSDDAGGLFSIDTNTGVITVANALDYEAATSHSVTVLATSSDTSTRSQAFTINVTDINESAVGPITDSNAGANTLAESALVGDTVGITALATDADGTDTVTYSLSDDAGGLFTIDTNTGVITVANALDYETATSHSVTVLATSSDTSTSSQAFTINVTDINESAVGPVTDNDGTANTVAEDAIVGTTVGITALATDPDAGDTVTYSLSDNAGGLFTIDANTGVITVANALDYETATSHSVTVLATSSDTSTSSQAFTINVTDINESAVGPVTDSNAAANTVAEDAIVGTTVGLTSLATDADGTDSVTYSLSDDAGGLFTIDSNTGVITIANALDYETATSHSVTVLATSSDTSTSSQAFTINVTDINESAVGPVNDSNAAANTVAEDAIAGTTVGITAIATDADGTDTVTYSLSDDAGGLFTIDANTGVITVANALDYETNTSHTVTVLATSDDGSTSSQAFTINVTDVNEVPTINDATLNVDENAPNGAAVGNVSGTDLDSGDTHVYTITAGNTNGAFAIDNAGNITVANSAALNFETTPVFILTVQIQDQGGTGLTDTATITINLNNLNEAPITSGIANVTVAEDAPNTVIDLFAAFADTEDADASLTYTITANTNPGLFTATPIDGVAGTLTLDYAPNANGTANISVRATDTSAMWVESTFTVTVNPDNDAPATTPVTLAAISEDSGGRLITQAELLANATDVDSPALTATNLTISAGSGTLVDNGDGTWNYTPDANDDTSVSFTYTVTDGSLTAAGSATLDITPVNDAPVTNNDSATVDEGRNVVINLVGNDADVENALDFSSITITAAPTNGSLVDNSDGTLTYTHDGSKTISDSFSYTINDVSGAISNIASVSLTVNPSNDNDPADSTDPNPTLEDPITDEDEDSDAEGPTYEAPGENPLAEDEPLLLVEEYQAPEDSGDADESFVQIKDSQDEETQEIIYLTDEIDRNAQPEGRDDDRGYTYYDNDLYKDMSSLKYWNLIDYAAQSEPAAVNLDDINILDFDSDDKYQVGANDDYDALRQEIDESFNTELKGQAIKAKIVTATAATFTVGIVSYLLRAGSLVASMMSALPLWRGFDPIAIFSGNKKKKKKQDKISDAGELKPEMFFEGDAE